MLDSDEDPRYNNWRRLWERKKKPRRRLALAWLRRLSYSPTSHQAPSIPPQNFELLSSTPMADNPSNLPIEDQFLRWRQDMERKLDDQARQMTDLRLLSERLQQENNRLLEREHARLQERQSGDENPRDDPRGSGNPSLFGAKERSRPYKQTRIPSPMTSYLPATPLSPATRPSGSLEAPHVVPLQL